MAQFITTTFSGGNDVALQLAQEEWVRTLAIGSSWNYVRIGMLFQIVGTAATQSTSGFSIGMCSGTSLPFGSTSCQNFVGIEYINAITWVSNSPNPYYQLANTNVFACKKLGSAITTSGGGNLADSIAMSYPSSSGNARRGIVYVDITKGSPNYTIGFMGTTNTYIAHDFTVAELITGMTVPFANGWTLGGQQMVYGNGAVTLACDEAAGGFDTVDIYVNELNNPINIYAVAVEKLA